MDVLTFFIFHLWNFLAGFDELQQELIYNKSDIENQIRFL